MAAGSPLGAEEVHRVRSEGQLTKLLNMGPRILDMQLAPCMLIEHEGKVDDPAVNRGQSFS